MTLSLNVMESVMHRQNNNTTPHPRTAQGRAPNARDVHPYTRALSRDALLEEVDDRLFDGGEIEEVEELLHFMEPGHGLTPGNA